MPSTLRTTALLCTFVISACSDREAPASDSSAASDGAPADAAPLPTTLSVTSGKTTVKLGTGTFSLSLLHDGKELTTGKASSATDPFGLISLGQAKPFLDNRYYDPAKPPDYVSWSSPSAVNAGSSSGASHSLTLAKGVTLTVKPAKVSGAIRLELSAPAPRTKQQEPQVALARVCFAARDKEVFFGFGELLDTVASRGVVRPMQMAVDMNIDSGLNEVHVPVPLAISPRGWALLVQDFHAGAFDVTQASKDHLCATFQTHKLTFFLMTDLDPLALVQRTVALTAKPALPPDWAFAPQQWRNALADQAELLADAAAMRKHKLPASVVWIDNPWQTGYNTHEFDPKQFPDAKGTIAKLHAQGYKVLVWSTPYVNVDQTAMYAHANKQGWLVHDSLGAPLAYKWGAGKGSLVDFSAPGAVAYWQSLLKKVTALGINGYKLDYGEEAVVALGAGLSFFRFHGGRTAATMHREYPGLYHSTYLDSLPKGEGFLITRAGSLGEQRTNTCIWPGDLDATFETHAQGRVGGLPAAITAGLSLSASGYPFFGSDIGGYRKSLPTTELLGRWAEYAALGTIMQLGGGGKNHNPWDTTLYKASALAHYRKYARLHMDLFPTIYSLAKQAAATGRPVTRPLGMAFATDPATWNRNFQFMLGDHLLVAPVITAGATSRKVYLPAGKWVSWWDRKVYLGGQEHSMPAALGAMPLLLAQGGVVATLVTPVDTLAPATDKSVSSYQDHKAELGLRILPPASGSTRFALFDGTVVEASSAAVSVTPGKQFTDFRLTVDWQLQQSPKTPATVSLGGKALASVGTAAAVASCAKGCWFFDSSKKLLLVRVLAPAGMVLVK